MQIIMSHSRVSVDAVTISHHDLINNGQRITFSVSSSASSSGDALDVDNVVKQASFLSNTTNFVESHSLLARYTIAAPLNIYANESDYKYKSVTNVHISYQ